MRNVFRENALKNQHSTSKVADSVLVTKPKNVVWLVAITLVILFGVVWSIVGEIPEFVDGAGIVSGDDEIKQVKIPFSGTVNTVEVQVGDTIEEGDLILTIDQYDLQFEIKKIQSNLNELQTRFNRISRYYDVGQKAKILDSLVRDERSMLYDLKTFNRQIAGASENDAILIRSKIEVCTESLEELKWKIIECKNFKLADIDEVRNRLLEMNNALNEKKSEYNIKTKLRSPYSGLVLELTLGEGDYFTTSHSVMTLENFDQTSSASEAIVFVDAFHSKKLKKGMKVYLEPSTFLKEEYGYIIGEVMEVAEYPSSKEGLDRILRNDELISRLTSNTLPVYVKVRLLEDKTNTSGLKWTTGKGPNSKIVAGTLISAKVVLDVKSPLELMFPSIGKE